MKKSIVIALVMGATALGGCAGKGEKHGAKLAPGDAAASQAALAKFKALEGEWDMVQPDGKRGPGLSIAMVASGSAVREVMFPGTDHQMVNMYHADGGTLVMTHYCAKGNQPRMRAEVAGDGNSFDFKPDSVTNLQKSHNGYMGSMVLTIVDKNTIRQDWRHHSLDGKIQATHKETPPPFTYKRHGT